MVKVHSSKSVFDDAAPGSIQVPRDGWLPIAHLAQMSDGSARLEGLSVCDCTGTPRQVFSAGETAYFVLIFNVYADLASPVAGLAMEDLRQFMVHGKDTLQLGLEVPAAVRAHQRLRFCQAVTLDLPAGKYELTYWLASAPSETLEAYRAGRETLSGLQVKAAQHCRILKANIIEIVSDKPGMLQYFGSQDLPGQVSLRIVEQPSSDGAGRPFRAPAVVKPRPGSGAIVHVTHWKAGSQWINKILRAAAPDRIVEPQVGNIQFLQWPLVPGAVYPTVYVTREEYYRANLPPGTRRFVVIRDLRDTLVSGYFSMAYSHGVRTLALAEIRAKLTQLDLESGLLYLIETWLPLSASIQISWLEGGEDLIRYEDLLKRDTEILEDYLLGRCRLGIGRDELARAVEQCRFSRITGGRDPGVEDQQAHERKGVAGDWRNHFGEKVKRAFKLRYGGLLVATGYEQDLDW